MARGLSKSDSFDKQQRLILLLKIFRHHISLVEGHLKMVDMVRKHTVEGTGNWTMIVGCLERAQEMLATSKQISRNFVSLPK